MSEPVAAFFDVDDTLVCGNTALLLGRFLALRGEIPLSDFALRGAYYWIGHVLHRLDYREVIRHGARLVAGRCFDDVMEWGRACVRETISGRIYSEALSAIDTHRRAGHRVVLVSSAPRMVIEALAGHLSVGDALYTDGEVADGIVTGRVLEPACWGEGKRQLAEAFARAHGLSLLLSYFYTDSVTDLPLLRRVGHPRAVKPDRHLRKAALAHGWPILSFRTLARRGSTIAQTQAQMGKGAAG